MLKLKGLPTGKSLGSCSIDPEVLKRGYQMGFVTPVVHALTDGNQIMRGGSASDLLNLPLTLKFPTWQVMLQSRKSKELTVNFYSCGSYDLIRDYALNLTSSRGFLFAQQKRRGCGSPSPVHGSLIK